MAKKAAARQPPPRKSVVGKVLIPVQEFIQTESASGIVLIAAAALAFAWANSPWAASYFALLDLRIGMGVGAWSLEKPLLLWVNDLLMALFFFVIGLEIKREILVGELAGWQRAALPAAGALGGMVVPALIYVAFNLGAPTMRGWGVPMATDIAFALGVLALLGERVPLGLKVFLLALAIVDDLGAVLVIALFYTESRGRLVAPGRAGAVGRGAGLWPRERRAAAGVRAARAGDVVLHAQVRDPRDRRGRADGAGRAAPPPSEHAGSAAGAAHPGQPWRRLRAGRGRDRAARGGAGQGAQPFAQPGARARPVSWRSSSCRCSPSSTPASRSAAAGVG